MIRKALLFLLVAFPFASGAQPHPVTGCYWEWMNGNISREGITKDLEYMKAAGIESAFIFDTWIGVERGPVDYGSAEWASLVKFACQEAERLGILLGIHNAPGYTATGGPWIHPEESMKQLTWSVSQRRNPPVPVHKMGFYRDIKTFRTDCADEMQSLHLHLEEGEQVTVALSREKPFVGFNLWRGEREKPLDPFDGPRDYAPRLRVETSRDGFQWKDCGFVSGPALRAHDVPIHFSCEEVYCRYLRLTSSRGTNLDRIEILTSPGSGHSYRRVGYTTTGQLVTAAPESGIGLEVDKLSRRGVKSHCDRFLGPLLEELRPWCGKTLRWVVIDSWEAGRQDWTDSFDVTSLDSIDYLHGGLGRKTGLKERLLLEEYVRPLKEFIAPYGLSLAGEPYGDGDFEPSSYASILDLPMSEYWARSHYGTIERPRRVSRYAHSDGKPIVGCEFGTAYPGDADIPATLGSFRKDVDALCEAGVNYFVLHCVTHQDRDDRPLTMGPFGTRFDRLHADADSVRALTDYIRGRVFLQQNRVTFDYVTGEPGSRAFLRLPRGSKQVRAVLYCHQNMTEEVLFRSASFCRAMDSLGVAMAFVQRGSQNWDPATDCQPRFEALMADFAQGTEHPEIASAPVIPFGHSAQATFPWNFAAWNPERTLCIVSYHGDAPRTNLCGYGRANVEWGRTRNIDRIPGLMIMGEYEWWEARLLPALAFRMMYPESRISFLCDAGRGHFDLCPETQAYIAKFIEKALQDSRPEGGVYFSRWYEDGHETADPHEQFWYPDEEMARLARARYAAVRGKRMQYLSARVNGELLVYDPEKHIKMNATVQGDTFTVEPVFVDESRNAPGGDHAAVRPRVVLISGPAIQTGEYTFRIDPDYFGTDPERLWSGITLCVEADGDAFFKPVVQELNLQVRK